MNDLELIYKALVKDLKNIKKAFSYNLYIYYKGCCIIKLC